MTVYKRISIECDWPGCYARSGRGRLDLGEARKTAEGDGWKTFHGLIDLCGPADQALEPAAWSGSRPQGHATAGHDPVLSAEGRDRISVACSCGWKDRSSWAPVRSVARYCWATHVKEAVADQAVPPSGGERR
jgi:hypothetical protein